MRHRSMLRQAALGVVLGCGAFGGGIVVPVSVLGAEPNPPAVTPSIPPAEIARWVRELNDDSYSVREAATTKLVEAGPAAVEPLAAAVLSDSAEVAWRAGTAIQRIAVHGDEATVNQVSAALTKLTTKRPAITKLAADIRVKQQKFRHTRAIAQVRALGGQLDGTWGDSELAMAAEPFEAIEIVDVELAPAVLEVADAPAVAPIPLADPFDGRAVDPFGDPEPAPAPREGGGGLIGLLARLLLPGAEEPIPDAPALPEPAPVPAEFFPAEVVPLAPRLEDAPAEDPVPRFEAPELPDVPEPLIPVPAPADVPVPVEAEAAALEVAEDVGGAIAIDAFAGPIMVDEWSESSEAYAELSLSKNFRGSDADLAVLKDIPEIYSLSIAGAKLSDKALPHIGELPRLTTLNVRDTEFSSAALRKLRAQRPNLSVICRAPAMLGINAGLEGSCILTSVFPRSGAAEAGLRDGDEIIEVDGQRVRDFSDLTIAVYPHRAGDKLPVKYRRSGKVETVDVVLKPRVQVETEE